MTLLPATADERCNCGSGWATFSGHSLDCPRNAIAGRMRMRVERADLNDRATAEDRTVRVGTTRRDIDDLPTPSEL